jgi:hypothetical protein
MHTNIFVCIQNIFVIYFYIYKLLLCIGLWRQKIFVLQKGAFPDTSGMQNLNFWIFKVAPRALGPSSSDSP